MQTKKISPYGSWKSPITPDLVFVKAVGIGQIAIDGSDIYWTEVRPFEGGRTVIVKRTPDGKIKDLTPPPFNARTRAHEYGGGQLFVHQSTTYFANFTDQRLYQIKGGEISPLTPEAAMRYADMQFDSSHNRLICVCEDHSDPDIEPVNTIATVDLETGSVKTLLSGHDFFSFPRISPDGRSLAWTTWDHPNMPWDSSTLWLGDFDETGDIINQRKIAGDGEESIFQPVWSPKGNLFFVSDRNNWWNIYRWKNGVTPVLEMDAEFGLPQWVFGLSTYGFISDEKILCRYTQNGVATLAILNTETSALTPLDLPYDEYDSIITTEGKAVFVASSSTEHSKLVLYNFLQNTAEVLLISNELYTDPGYISLPQPIEFPTTGGLSAFGNYYPPKNKDFQPVEGEKPPLLIKIHGGPTGNAGSTLSYAIQYWTSRGIAVLDVNYGGSTGYGRDFRDRLKGNWGIVDVDDCTNGALYLVDQGLADRNRLIIRGGSAGGYTTLATLVFKDVFSVGASFYGVSDLEALAKDTHKFESRYMDQLVGPYPKAIEIYHARSPIYHIQKLTCPVLFLQGLEDKVVPPIQSEMMFNALVEKGIPTAYIGFPGEQHGFRNAETIKRSWEAELYFYGKIFCFTPADPIEPVDIQNLTS